MPLLPQASRGPWSSAEIHDTVEAIARQPIYSTQSRQSLGGRLLRFIYERLTDLIAFFRGSPNARLITIAAVAVAVFVVVARIVAARQVDAERRRAMAGRRASMAGTRDFWAAARDLAAAGDYAGACHALYGGVLDALSHQGALTLHESKTSGDYARELYRGRSPVVNDYRRFARDFDRAVYGHEGVSADDFARLSRAAEAVAQPAALA